MLRKSSRLRQLIDYGSRFLRRAGSRKPDCRINKQRKRPRLLLSRQRSTFSLVRFESENCELAGISGDSPE